jgi:hypothetical protein
MVTSQWITEGSNIRLAIAIVQPKTIQEQQGRLELIKYIQGAGFAFQGNSHTHHLFIAADTPGRRLVANAVAQKQSEAAPWQYGDADKMTLATARNAEQGRMGSTSLKY